MERAHRKEQRMDVMKARKIVVSALKFMQGYKEAERDMGLKPTIPLDDIKGTMALVEDSALIKSETIKLITSILKTNIKVLEKGCYTYAQDKVFCKRAHLKIDLYKKILKGLPAFVTANNASSTNVQIGVKAACEVERKK